MALLRSGPRVMPPTTPYLRLLVTALIWLSLCSPNSRSAESGKPTPGPVQIGEGDPHILRVTILTKSTVPENNGNLSLSLRAPDFTWDTKDTTETWQGTIVANPDHADSIGKFNPRECHPDVQALLTAITNDPQILSGWDEFFNRRSVERTQQSFSHPLFGGGAEPPENVNPVPSTPVDIKTLRSHARFH